MIPLTTILLTVLGLAAIALFIVIFVALYLENKRVKAQIEAFHKFHSADKTSDYLSRPVDVELLKA